MLGHSGNPLCVYAAWRACREQVEFAPTFVMLVGILESLLHVEGRSILSVMCSSAQSSSIKGLGVSVVHILNLLLGARYFRS